MPNNFEGLLIEKFKVAGINLTAEQAVLFSRLTFFMLEYNKKVNLTRITEPGAIIEKHYIDSILPLRLSGVDVLRGTIVCDVGAGAGFPSLPMKIYRPDLDMTMIDSLNKRVSYLNQAIPLLELNKCRAIHGRGDELGRNATYREHFEMVTARAVANLKILAEYCLPLVKVNGIFLAMKGAESETSKEADEHIKKLGGIIEKTIAYNLPGGDKRNLVIIRKKEPTAKVFPRNSGIIQKMR